MKDMSFGQNSNSNSSIYLPRNTMLFQRYAIEDVVNTGRFGIVYKAYDTKSNIFVAVKEFFVNRYMTRNFTTNYVIVSKNHQDEFERDKSRFLTTARSLAFSEINTGIPEIYEYFEQNGTAYIVMEFLGGQTLDNFLSEDSKSFNREFAIYTIKELCYALEDLHKRGITHSAVCPENIFICSETGDSIKLLGYDRAKLPLFDDKRTDVLLNPGYSAIEQYDVYNQDIGPWSDVYSLGAVFYALLTGIRPDEAIARKICDNLVPPHIIDNSIPENLSNVIMKAMALEKNLRFKTVADFLQAINGEKVLSLAEEKKFRARNRVIGVIAAVMSVVITITTVINIYASKKDKQTLDDAKISLWFASAEESTEVQAIDRVIADFREKFPGIVVDVRAIDESKYADEIANAVRSNSLPTLFESTGLSDDIMQYATDLTDVVKSAQADECLFFEQYYDYYSNAKKIPLGIDVPMAYVITKGNTAFAYDDLYFYSINNFGADTKISVDTETIDLWNRNMISTVSYADETEFLNNTANTSPVMLSTSMALNEIKKQLPNYEKKYVYYNVDNIFCRFTYEWSMGNGSKDQIKAAKWLLSRMLGNSYQNILMISDCSDGQIPVNYTAFKAKLEQKDYSPIKEIYMDFVFENREGQN